MARLQKVLRHCEDNGLELRSKRSGSMLTRLVKRQRGRAWLLEPIFLSVIVANIACVTVEIDHGKHSGARIDGWTVTSGVFCCLFWIELLWKLHLQGIKEYFCVEGQWRSNCFDAICVIADTAQMIMVFSLPEDGSTDLPAVSLFRMLRLFRLFRLIRLLRSSIFQDLTTMGQAFYGGLSTLAWSTVLIFSVLFATSLFCREMIGNRSVQNLSIYFSSVPRSLFTLFRCSFGDCVTEGGASLIERIIESYGSIWALGYCFFVFTITIGFFNVITAIFLETAADVSLRKERMRLADKDRWSSGVALLLRKLIEATNSGRCSIQSSDKLSDNMDAVMAINAKRKDVNDLVNDAEVKMTLDDLDIDPHDQGKLGDILDADHSGEVSVLEFVNGLQRIRGSTLKRSDVVSIDLMVRALQEQISDEGDRSTEMRNKMEYLQEQFEAFQEQINILSKKIKPMQPSPLTASHLGPVAEEGPPSVSLFDI